MLNRNLLKAEIVKNGLTQKAFCILIDMPQSTFARKLNRGSFTTSEAERMISALKISNPIDIFFVQEITL